MRILVEGGSTGSGGYVRYLAGMLGAQVPADIDVTFLCSPSLAARVGELPATVRTVVEPALEAPRRRSRTTWWDRDYPALVARLSPDLVLHATGLVRGRSGDVPLVVVHHNQMPFAWLSYRQYGMSRQSAETFYWRRRLVRGMKRASGVQFTGYRSAASVRRQIRSMPLSVVAPNGVPAEYANLPLTAPRTLSPPIRILCVTTLHLFKFHWNVVDAVAGLRYETGLDLRLTFVGGGEPRARARLHEAISYHSAAHFTEVHEDVPIEEMPRYYRSADIFVFPSALETWPITLLEAMSAGLPIVCSGRMDMPSMLRDAGRYFDPESPGQLAAAIRTLLVDDELRVMNAKKAQEYARENTWQRSADILFPFLRDIAADAAHRRAGTRRPSRAARRRNGLVVGKP